MSGKKESVIIKIVSKEYEVIKSTPLEINDEVTWGYIDYSQCKIHIDSDLCFQMQKNALNHEIVHGILYEMGCELHKDEQFTEAFSNILTQVLTDNKDTL